MADPTIAIQATLRNEGGFSNNSNDPGGATNMGITQADMPGQDISALTVAQAVAYYQEHFWKPFYSQILNQPVASKLFDLGVLFGVGTAVKILQSVLGVMDDGIFGAGTLQATNAAEPTGLLLLYKAAMVRRAQAVAVANPAESIFLTGWERRINS